MTRPEYFALGLDDKTIARDLHLGDLNNIGPGLHAGRDYSAMTPEEQHVLRCQAVATRFPEQVAFTHQSAALLHDLPVWGFDLDTVHVTRLDHGRGRRQADVAHHVSEIRDDEIESVGTLTVSTPARTIWDLATSSTTESTLVTADAALRTGLVDDSELHAMAARYTSWRGSRHAKVALSLTDARSESPGESRARWAFHEGGLPRPVSQHKIFGRTGRLVGIADFAWPEFRHLVEFDGLFKYGNNLDLAREKAREDELRGLGWGMTRIIWSQLSETLRPTLVAELTEALDQSRRLYARP